MAITICRSFRSITAFVVFLVLAIQTGSAQEPASQLGGTYSDLDARRRQLVDNWVARFVKTTGQQVEAGPFYDDVLSVSAKTTFDAVTHALLATTLTDQSGASLGDALALVDQVETVRGEVTGAPGDHQFDCTFSSWLGWSNALSVRSSSNMEPTTPSITEAIRSTTGRREVCLRFSSRLRWT